MFMKLCNMVRSSPIRTIPIIILIIFITAATNLYSYKIESETFSNFKAGIEQQSEEETWKQITSMIHLANIAARQNSKFIAKKLEVDILRQYPNLNELQREFEDDKFGEKFHKILKNNLIVQNDSPSALYPQSFHTIVGLDRGVLEVFSSSETSTSQTSGDHIISWDTFSKTSPNPVLADQAIDAVLTKDDGLIFWQTKPGDTNVTEMSLASLRQAYDKGGFEALRYFSIVSPSYITDSGDIFNIDDKTYMIKNKNYKLIIMQSFNLYDILQNYRYELQKTQSISDHNQTVISGLEQYEFLRMIFWSAILFIVCLFFVKIYNSDTKKCQDNCKRVRGMD